MNISHLKKLFGSSTIRVALSYLAIIMAMSIFFSLVFFNASSRELRRQLPPSSFYSELGITQPKPQPLHRNEEHGEEEHGEYLQPQNDVDRFLRERIREGRHSLMLNLITLNAIALLAGSIVSYFLARYTLRPIENAMDAQGRFVSDASHELRTPLTAIQVGNEVALRKPNLSLEEAKEMIQSNVEEITKLRRLSDDLLALAGQEHSQLIMEPVSIQDVVMEALNRVVQLALAKNIAVVDNVPPDIKVRVEKQKLVEVLVILLDNAIKYSDENKNIYLESYKKGKFGIISIHDEGPGIRATDQRYIFERFYRANSARSKETHNGYGLGLSIAKKIVEQLRGSISVESKLNEGSTFLVKLPLA